MNKHPLIRGPLETWVRMKKSNVRAAQCGSRW